MATELKNNMPRQARVEYYLPPMQASFYAHKNILESARKHHVITVELGKALVWCGDLAGLLYDQGVPADLHHIVYLMNDISDPTDYDASILTFKIPFEEDVVDIAVRHRSLDS